MRAGRSWKVVVLGIAAVLTGCDQAALDWQVFEPEPAAETGTRFDAAHSGRIIGRVTWNGPQPTVPPFRAATNAGIEWGVLPRLDWPNPLAPRIEKHGKGVAGAVVYLRGVNPALARPWDHEPVRIEVVDYQVRIGPFQDHIGFVQRGATVPIVSRIATYELLQLRGGDFRGFALPTADCETAHRFERRGIVELRSGAGHYWLRGYLFVDDHPYYERTDAEGGFTLAQVPAGEYELVCWHPNWHAADHDRDGETASITRLRFQPPVEKVVPVHMKPGHEAEVRFVLKPEDFSGE